jgi:hypothetical protein
MIKSDYHPRAFGSAFDPLLDGVAQGLADLFPLSEPPMATDKLYEETVSELQEQHEE